MPVPSPRVFAAVDLGASGGRVIAGVVDDRGVALHTIHRFPNGPQEREGRLRWDILALYDEILTGIARLAREFPEVGSIGIDTWGVDYALLDDSGNLLAQPVAYRDERTAAVVDAVHDRVSRDELYRINGLQFLPFNTIYQLAAERREEHWARAARVVLLPDLIAYWLTGELRTEATNASTTGLVDLQTGTWASDLLERLDLRPELFAPIETPGWIRGPVRPEICTQLGLRAATVVTTVGSHDTASAVVGVPATDRRFAFVSSGTWSLVGMELDGPITTTDAQTANFTNEAGVDGRTRFLRNTGGLWLLQESLRTWTERGPAPDPTAVLAEAAVLETDGPCLDVDDPEFFAPGDMPTRIAAACGRSGARAPETPAETVRCILDSLADVYARTARDAASLARGDVDRIHIVGGGSQSELLCRRTAAVADLPVVAGPVEATVLGNVLVQARAHGVAPQSLDDIRVEMARTVRVRRFEPSGAGATR